MSKYSAEDLIELVEALKEMYSGSLVVQNELDAISEIIKQWGERGKGCDHCKNYKDIAEDDYGNTINLNQRLNYKGMYIEYSGAGESMEAYINYCPMCGKKLREGSTP